MGWYLGKSPKRTTLVLVSNLKVMFGAFKRETEREKDI